MLQGRTGGAIEGVQSLKTQKLSERPSNLWEEKTEELLSVRATLFSETVQTAASDFPIGQLLKGLKGSAHSFTNH